MRSPSENRDVSAFRGSLAVGDYDRVRDVVYGAVTAEGLNINFQALSAPEMFERATRDQEADACEMSLGMLKA